MLSVYSSSLGPVPRLIRLDHMPWLPVKSEMRPPNSTDCLTSKPSPVSPLFFSVSTAVARSLDLCAASTLTPGVKLALWSVGPVSLACCAGSDGTNNSIASTTIGRHNLLR